MPRSTMAVLIVCFVVVLGAMTLLLSAGGVKEGPQFSEWSTPQPVTELNTASAEYPNCISRDGLSLYFHRVNSGTGEDLYVVHRPDHEASWGIPIKLPDTINSTANERGAFLSSDGLWMFFSSDRPGGLGANDLYISWRAHVHDDGGWKPAVNLSAINSAGFESGPTLFEDEESGKTQLYFNSAPYAGGTQAVADIYVSTLGSGGFGPPSAVVELNSPVQEGRPYIRHDGREIYFQSNRSGAMAIWVSTRSSPAEPWSAPALAMSAADLNDASVQLVATPVLTWDRQSLLVGVSRPGIDTADIYVSTREKLRGKP